MHGWQFDASHLVCGGCSDQGGQECKKHGKEYMYDCCVFVFFKVNMIISFTFILFTMPQCSEWKCKFCCNISSWFCWGNTHFCESCHKKQVAGDYMTKKKPSDLPKCPGAKDCPLKVHNPSFLFSLFLFICYIFPWSCELLLQTVGIFFKKHVRYCYFCFLLDFWQGNHPPPGSEVCIGCAMCRYVGNF